jgi:hypothetical protein
MNRDLANDCQEAKRNMATIIPAEVAERLPALRDDYEQVEGKPFNHFFCPIFCRDEDVELCMGHVVNQKIPNCCRAAVVQRKDVDGFYGRVFESDFIVWSKIHDKDDRLPGVLTDPQLSKVLKPRILADGEACGHYLYKGHKSPDHSPIILENDSGEVVRLVLQKSPAEMRASLVKKWQVETAADFRVCALVPLIKAAYLTLFKLLGYRYALSAAGLGIGHDILGRFYSESLGKSPSETKTAATEFFRPYVNMMRPIERFTGAPPLGTVEDYRAMTCFGSSGRPFAMVVCVRTDSALHAVFMPGFSHPESVATYHDFMSNNTASFQACECVFEPENGRWVMSETPAQMVWPKNDVEFAL